MSWQSMMTFQALLIQIKYGIVQSTIMFYRWYAYYFACQRWIYFHTRVGKTILTRARRSQHFLDSDPNPHRDYALNIFKKYFFMFAPGNRSQKYEFLLFRWSVSVLKRLIHLSGNLGENFLDNQFRIEFYV
jgi:hypothetical protein